MAFRKRDGGEAMKWEAGDRAWASGEAKTYSMRPDRMSARMDLPQVVGEVVDTTVVVPVDEEGRFDFVVR